jgi:hypothetical protein
VRKPVLDLIGPKQQAEAVFEILWRRTIAFLPLDLQLAAALTDLVDANLPEVDTDMRLEFALALMRDARVSNDDEGLKRWAAIIEAEAAPGTAMRQAAEYQLCLRARDRMDFSGLAARLANISSEDPIWKLRRAALHTEIGEYAMATRLIKDAMAVLERRHRLDRSSLSIKSQLAWASWVSRAEAWSTRLNDLPRPRDFKELDIDPPGEIEYIARNAGDIEKARREDAGQAIIAMDRAEFTSAAAIPASTCCTNSINSSNRRAFRSASITSIFARTRQRPPSAWHFSPMWNGMSGCCEPCTITWRSRSSATSAASQ